MSESDLNEDKPNPLRLKVMTLLNVQPGRADVPKVGEEISILTFEHDGEIECPMLLNISDTRKLAIMLLGVMAHHGDALATEIVEKYFMER